MYDDELNRYASIRFDYMKDFMVIYITDRKHRWKTGLMPAYNDIVQFQNGFIAFVSRERCAGISALPISDNFASAYLTEYVGHVWS